MRTANGRAGRLVDADGVEAHTFGNEEHITGLKPVRLFAARKGGAGNAGPVHPALGVNILHLHSYGVAVDRLVDGATKGMT